MIRAKLFRALPGRGALVVLSIALAGCPPRGNKLDELKYGRVVYADKDTGFEVRHNEMDQLFVERGEVGELHPAVLEYILSADEGPLAAYYDLILGLASPPRRAATDLEQLAPEAIRLAGSATPRGHHYARALARKLAPEINRTLNLKWANEEFNEIQFLGTAGLWWGLAADLDANVLQRRYERSFRGRTLRTVIIRHASAGLVVVRTSGTDRMFVWDIGGIPGAFDPTKPLDYDAVAAQIVALHPFVAAPARAP
jgi:hypothetical protein